MSTVTKLGGFIVGLGLVLAVAFGVGRLAGPVQDEPVTASHHDKADGASDATGSAHDEHGVSSSPSDAAASVVPGGLRSLSTVTPLRWTVPPCRAVGAS